MASTGHANGVFELLEMRLTLFYVSVTTLFCRLQTLIKSALQQFSEDTLDISAAARGVRSRAARAR